MEYYVFVFAYPEVLLLMIGSSWKSFKYLFFAFLPSLFNILILTAINIFLKKKPLGDQAKMIFILYKNI
ncbi:MAG: hypothetical protein CMG63_00775 [Candidatus Marinimicrobia bacterium]|nr:hypothetical protein [Candidatus Neomarinimicrobiota bacterium]